MKMKIEIVRLPLLLLSLCFCIFVSCKKKKAEEYTTQELIDQGKSISELLDERPADSLIGLIYQSGLIFYVDTSAATALVVSQSDISSTAWWGCNGQYIDGVQGSTLGLGDSNTYKIATNCNDASSAAGHCYYSTLNNYHDWYLPCEDEMKLVYSALKAKNVGDFQDDYYWTSTQHDQYYARYLLFLDGSVGFKSKSDPHRVRGIRSVY